MKHNFFYQYTNQQNSDEENLNKSFVCSHDSTFSVGLQSFTICWILQNLSCDSFVTDHHCQSFDWRIFDINDTHIYKLEYYFSARISYKLNSVLWALEEIVLEMTENNSKHQDPALENSKYGIF